MTSWSILPDKPAVRSWYISVRVSCAEHTCALARDASNRALTEHIARTQTRAVLATTMVWRDQPEGFFERHFLKRVFNCSSSFLLLFSFCLALVRDCLSCLVRWRAFAAAVRGLVGVGAVLEPSVVSMISVPGACSARTFNAAGAQSVCRTKDPKGLRIRRRLEFHCRPALRWQWAALRWPVG